MRTWFALDRLELDLVEMLPSAEGGMRLRKYSGPRAMSVGLSDPGGISHRTELESGLRVPVCSSLYSPGCIGLDASMISPCPLRITGACCWSTMIRRSTVERMKSHVATPELSTNSSGKVPMRWPDCAHRMMMGPDVVFHE